VSIALILVVLMQSSKGEGLAGSLFGGGIGGAVFGGRGAASFLTKATTYLAVLFMINCGALAFMSSSRDQTMTDPSSVTTSPVTEQAQREREQQAASQQAAQQQRIADSISRIQVIPGEGTQQPIDTTVGGSTTP